MDKIEILKDRARLLASTRTFFSLRNITEVDCPLLSASASVDAHIDLIPAITFSGTRYLHSSPEYGMKRLLSEGIGDIYQLSHVFRDGEYGEKHNPEFMMAEWYRLNFNFGEMIEETLDFIRLFLGDLPASSITYREAFHKYAGIDYVNSSTIELVEFLKRKNIQIAPGLDIHDKDALLNLIIGAVIEPCLGQNELCALTYYPASQAALARAVDLNGEAAAERFEVYFRGVELANGYHELADASEQRERLLEANAERIKLRKNPLPIDLHFLEALEVGLPDCCGVAVGFDRLMMLRLDQKRLASVIPFDWTRS